MQDSSSSITLSKMWSLGPIPIQNSDWIIFSLVFQFPFHLWVHDKIPSWDVVYLPSFPHGFSIVICISQHSLQYWFIPIAPYTLLRKYTLPGALTSDLRNFTC